LPNPSQFSNHRYVILDIKSLFKFVKEFESSFIYRIAEEMINSIILEATRIVEDDQQNDFSVKDDSDPFQVSQSSKISMEDNIDDEISIPTDDELENVSDDEIKVRQLSTDSTDELLNVPSPLGKKTIVSEN
jgi:hypothetical protein